jgi:hypothetical protein
MAKRSKIRITTNCQANAYASNNERIVEVGTGTEGVGCLLSIRALDDGSMVITAYRGTRCIVRAHVD